MNAKIWKWILALIASAVLVAGAFFVQNKNENDAEEVKSLSLYALDTFCILKVYRGGDEETLNRVSELLAYYDGLFDCEDTASDLYRINHRTSDRVEIAEDTAKMLREAYTLQELTEGALLISIRPLTELWDIKNRTEVPSEMEIKLARDRSAAGSWEIRTENGVSCFFSEDDNIKLETGAFAKGYIADRLKEKMVEEGVSSAVIDLGGNIQTVGSNSDGESFRIGIKDPLGSEDYKEILEITDESVVTAGINERYFEADGKRYHHILDPSTGYPVENELASVTVIGPSSFLCDGLATALFVLGRERANSLLTRLNTENNGNYSAVYILKNGETVR